MSLWSRKSQINPNQNNEMFFSLPFICVIFTEIGRKTNRQAFKYWMGIFQKTFVAKSCYMVWKSFKFSSKLGNKWKRNASRRCPSSLWVTGANGNNVQRGYANSCIGIQVYLLFICAFHIFSNMIRSFFVYYHKISYLMLCLPHQNLVEIAN